MIQPNWNPYRYYSQMDNNELKKELSAWKTNLDIVQEYLVWADKNPHRYKTKEDLQDLQEARSERAEAMVEVATIKLFLKEE